MSKLITITSGKGGVGKTTTSINLAAALNSFGKETIIVDANLTTPNVGLHLGAPIVPISLNHVLQGKAKIQDAIYEHESGTKIIPSSLSINELKRINHSRLKEVGKKLKKIYGNKKEIAAAIELYELFREMDKLEKVRENEFRKGVNLKVNYRGEIVNINLNQLKEYALILERFISYIK